MGDTDDVDCESCREVVSADLDREATSEESRVAEAHLDGCGPCRIWLESAAAVTRRARTRPAEEAPDLVGGVLHALDHGWPVRHEPSLPGPGRRLVLLVGGEAVSDCGCTASCGCGCQQGRPCRCGDHQAA